MRDEKATRETVATVVKETIFADLWGVFGKEIGEMGEGEDGEGGEGGENVADVVMIVVMIVVMMMRSRLRTLVFTYTFRRLLF
jgi:hypothetical protein